MKNNKVVKYIRWGLLAIFIIMTSVASYFHISKGGGEAASIHAICPFGGLESLYQFFTTGSFISKIYSGTMILFVITVVLAILFRRSFCGLICPFGAIQEFFTLLGKKIFKKKLIINSKIDKPLRYLKYVVLIITVYYAWKTAGLWMAPYDPWSAFSHLSEGIDSVWEESAVGLILLALTLIGSLLYDRFFCKYLCPVGALYGIIGKISPYKVTRNENTCVSCGLCNKACPMNIDVQNTKEVKSAECINCQSCVMNCPKDGTLESKTLKKTIKPIYAIVAVIVILFGSIFSLKLAGVYTVLPEKLKEGQVISFEEIKGYMTIEESAKATATEVKEFYKKFKIPENVPSNTMMKEISKTVPEYSFDEVKESIGTTTKSESKDTAPKDTKVSNLSAIKGSMTIKDAAKTVNISEQEFYKLFKIPESIASNTYMKDIGNTVPGYDFHKVIEELK